MKRAPDTAASVLTQGTSQTRLFFLGGTFPILSIPFLRVLATLWLYSFSKAPSLSHGCSPCTLKSKGMIFLLFFSVSLLWAVAEIYSLSASEDFLLNANKIVLELLCQSLSNYAINETNFKRDPGFLSIGLETMTDTQINGKA